MLIEGAPEPTEPVTFGMSASLWCALVWAEAKGFVFAALCAPGVALYMIGPALSATLRGEVAAVPAGLAVFLLATVAVAQLAALWFLLRYLVRSPRTVEIGAETLRLGFPARTLAVPWDRVRVAHAGVLSWRFERMAGNSVVPRDGFRKRDWTAFGAAVSTALEQRGLVRGRRNIFTLPLED